jgi:hypothetical protein
MWRNVSENLIPIILVIVDTKKSALECAHVLVDHVLRYMMYKVGNSFGTTFCSSLQLSWHPHQERLRSQLIGSTLVDV